MDKDTEIFKGKSFADIMEQVFNNSKKKDRQIKLLIAQLEPLIKDIDNAITLVPLIKEYLEISVKNDDQIVKLAAIMQRMMKDNGFSEDGGMGLSKEEKEQLLKKAKEVDDKLATLKDSEGK